jgi:hypothetical protein
VTLVGSVLRPELVTATHDGRLTCDTGADATLAGTIRAADDDPRPMLNIVTAINADGMRDEVLDRLAAALA